LAFLLSRQLKEGDLGHFPICRQTADRRPSPDDHGLDFKGHAAYVEQLQQEFEARFNDFKIKKPLYDLFTQPFNVDVETMPTEYQLEVIDLQSSSIIRAAYNKGHDLKAFYKLLDKSVYPVITENALKLVSLFGSSYICEQAFSVMNLNKSKFRARLSDEHLHSILRVASTGLPPNIEKLASQKNCNISH